MSRPIPPQRRWSENDRTDWLNAFARRLISGSLTWDPASVNANTTLDTTLSDLSLYPQLEGLRAGQWVAVTPPSTLDSGLVVGAAWIPADDQLTIRLRNVTGGAIDQASGTWSFLSWLL